MIQSLIFLLLTACSSGGEARAGDRRVIRVFAAASLAEAFAEMGEQFNRQNPGVEVVFNFAGSQALAQQISQGADADVFASANETQMQIAVDSGRVDANAVLPFAANRLVVAYPRDNPAQLRSLEDLAAPELLLVIAAAEVPAGRYTQEFLQKASLAQFGPDFRSRVLANVVSFEENVRSALSKVALGEADAGLVYQTDVLGDQAGNVGYLTIPDGLNVLAIYPLAPLQDSRNREDAEAFINFVLSPAGQEILKGFGFGIPPEIGG